MCKQVDDGGLMQDLLHNRTLVCASHTAAMAFALVIGLHVFFFFSAHSGYNASDDMAYARIAYTMSHNDFRLTPHPFSNRFGLTVPVAVSYIIFGTNILSATLWPILSSSLTLVLVFSATSKVAGRRAAVFSSLFLATNLVQIKYSSQLYPDLVLSLFLLCGIVALFRTRTSGSVGRQRLYAIICALSLFAGFLTKESAILVAPFMLSVMVYDVVRSRNTQFWIWLCVVGISLIAVYLWAYYVVTGDALYRINGIEQSHNVSQWSFFGKSFADYAKRLSYQPILFILQHPGYVILLVFSLPSLLGFNHSPSVLRSHNRFWSGYSLTLLLSFWFGSSSLVSFNPLPLEERFLIPLLAPLSILSGVALAKLFSDSPDGVNRKAFSFILLFGSFIIALVSALFANLRGQEVRIEIFIVLLPLLFCVFMIRPGHLSWKTAPQATLIATLVAIPTLAFSKGMLGESPPQKAEREIVQNTLANLQGFAHVYTDQRSVEALPFYLGFHMSPNMQLIDWGELDRHKDSGDTRVFVFINRHRVSFLNREYGVGMPGFVQVQPPGWKLLESREGIYLYGVQDGIFEPNRAFQVSKGIGEVLALE